MFGRFHKHHRDDHTTDELARLADEVAGLRADVKALVETSSAGDDISKIEQSFREKSSHTSSREDKAERSRKQGMVNPDDCDVMISLNCKTMLETAQRIRHFLETNGVKVWLCVNMAAGADFRDEIVAAVDSCEVFLPLINEAWCLSKECKYEFNYGFRKHLTSDTGVPYIVPMCFPDLDWNAHGHVRALLANTNALVYNPNEEANIMDKLKDSLVECGLTMKKNRPSSWAPDELRSFLEAAIIKPLLEDGENMIDGSAYLHMDSNALEEKIRKLAISSKEQMQHLEQIAKVENDTLVLATSMESEIEVLEDLEEEEEVLSSSNSGDDDGDGDEVPVSPKRKKKPSKSSNNVLPGSSPMLSPPPSIPSVSQISLKGMYKVIAKTTNYYDQNVTKSNVFLVTLSDNGIASTGCAWQAGTIHNNYDGVTSIWQGKYRHTEGSFFFSATYSNNTKEEYAGSLERDRSGKYVFSRGTKSKYAWFGYGRESYGMLDMLMLRLSKDEEDQVKKAMQLIAIEDSDAVPMEAVMQTIGEEISWQLFDRISDQQEIHIPRKGFCLTPEYNARICLNAPIAIQFVLPNGIDDYNGCAISIIYDSTNEPHHERKIYVNEYILARGYVFPKSKVPRLPGKYEIAFFNAENEKIASNPILVCQESLWK
ncbi:hypothetical protein CTEN210_15388 [Chaetoceros tenuissimus]|uniref:TIR domain-containing protein n=1 Tax=Chaetoceros tenuissimus TaxID=426638 RepID=A0AAD3D7K8_9STRA|nr:hypothetical protein CTEN210_15388 [Chaetoceros tenuissimus]